MEGLKRLWWIKDAAQLGRNNFGIHGFFFKQDAKQREKFHLAAQL